MRALLLALALVGCAAESPLVAAAGRGALAARKPQLEQRLRAGTLGRAEAARLAAATLDHELRTAQGEPAVRRVLEAEACAHAAVPALRARGKGRDAAGAEALLVLYEAGALSRGSALEHLDDANAAFRRVAVRALDRVADHALRAAYFSDSDGALRIAALRAAMIASDPRDAPALRERARLDPEPDARSNAVRALALLEDPPEDLASFLGELGKSASDALQGDIAVAWSLAPTFELGGREALVQLLSGEKTKPELRATTAQLLLRSHADSGLGQLAEAVLVRALSEGPVPVRLQVLRAPLPASPKLFDSVRALAKNEGRTEVGIAASEALLSASADVPEPERRGARARLYEIAKTDGRLGSHARLALARSGDRRVQAWLEHDLGARDPVRKLVGARGLAALGVAGRAAPLLADPDPSLRTRAACLILNAPPPRAL